MVSPSGAGASPSQPVKPARVPRPHRATEPPPAVPPVNANALPPSRQSVRFPEHGREEPAVRIRLHSHAREAPLGGTPHRSPALRHLREPLIDELARPSVGVQRQVHIGKRTVSAVWKARCTTSTVAPGLWSARAVRTALVWALTGKTSVWPLSVLEMHVPKRGHS